jgi:hypothetical protein
MSEEFEVAVIKFVANVWRLAEEFLNEVGIDTTVGLEGAHAPDGHASDPAGSVGGVASGFRSAAEGLPDHGQWGSGGEDDLSQQVDPTGSERWTRRWKARQR